MFPPIARFKFIPLRSGRDRSLKVYQVETSGIIAREELLARDTSMRVIHRRKVNFQSELSATTEIDVYVLHVTNVLPHHKRNVTLVRIMG